MNITDLIVEFVKEGNVVEFPGMGTLTSTNVDAHHDASNGTYYPARRSVTMTGELSGSKAIIRRIADKECVTNDIAEQMWNNYVAALKDKLQRVPSGHEFPGIGTMRLAGRSVLFDALEGLDLDADKRHEQPLENVATYTPKAVADPFAAFDKPAPKPEPEPEPAPIPEPEPVHIPEPEPIPAPQPEPKPEPIVEIPAAPAPKPEPAPAPVEQPAPEPAPIPEPAPVKKPTSSDEHFNEVKKLLDAIPESPKDPKEIRRAEKAAAKAEKEARKAAAQRERDAAKDSALAAMEEEKRLKAQEKEARRQEKAAAKAKKKEEKAKDDEDKKGHPLLWILLILLLLGGGATYYFTQVRNSGPRNGDCSQDVTLSYKDQFTGDRALLQFQENDIRYSVGEVHKFMADYIHTFLAARHYNNAFAPMMHEVDVYASNRLRELMVEGFCPKRLFPYDDFWMDHMYGEYKEAGAHYYRCQVQGELMDLNMLEGLLDEIVSTYGLHADGYGMAALGGANGRGNANANAKNDKPFEEVVPEAPTFKNSKQGFDIIAGFFTSKKSANKCANQLKALGSDAYIISKAGGFYVSMGSAPTYTAAQAMEKHIKSWYKSDVTIKNFNE